MISFLAFWVAGLVLIITQTTLLDYLPIWLSRPDFVFIFVTFAAYTFAWIPGILLVFVLSWIVDVVGGAYLGIYPLVCLITFTALKLLTNKSPIKESTYQIPLVGLSYFLMQMFSYFVYSLVMPDTLFEWSWTKTIQRTMLEVLSAVPLFVLLNKLNSYVLARRLRSKPPRRRSR